MQTRNTSRWPWLRSGLLLGAVVAALGLAACGSSSGGSGSSGNAQTLLKQTFASGKPVKSGVLDIAFTLTPSGSSTFTTPISFSISGPFQSRGTGKLPQSNFNVAISALGHKGQLGIVSTGTSGYVTLEGTAYQLPAADFQRLESGFSSVGSSGQGGGGLSSLGINPQSWLTNASVVGSDTIDGTDTTHIRAGVDVAALLKDVNTLLGKASSSTGTKVPSSIPPATQQKIAAAIKNASVDVWTGKSDKILRKLSLNLHVPVSGQLSTEAGGLTSAGIGFTLQYSDVNQPQTVAAPTNVKPYSEFTTKLRSVLAGIEGTVGAGSLGSTGSSGSGSGSSGSTGSSGGTAKVQKYSQCIQSAGQDVSKMQKCASILNGS
ncbi:MAG TPA: hypothetical protein VMF14_04445 [Solirubrobacteraceae bacterium]|nr:hypothetical protein [Solirubrobacteraceae bacterium]